MMLSKLSIISAAGACATAAAVSSDSVFKVSAAASKDTTAAAPASNAHSNSDDKKQAKKQIRACELPLYDEPPAPVFEVVPFKPSAYYQAISDARKWVWTYRDSIQDTTKQVTDAYDRVKNYSLDGLQYLQKDSGTVPRAIFISSAGLLGIVFAFRGGFIRRTFYASVGMAGAASICYPAEARDISTRGWKAARGIIITAYKDLSGLPPNEPLEKPKVPVTAESGQKKPVTDKPINSNEQKTLEAKSTKPVSSAESDGKKDFGMSKLEDQDMYTTRGGK